MNIKNLELLAAYLEALPADYTHFGLGAFLNNGISYNSLARSWSAVGSCGTSACAVGHAPNVEGIPEPLSGEGWFSYSERVFGTDRCSESWDWCFSQDWSDFDNSHQGAAARIRYLIKNPELEGWVSALGFCMSNLEERGVYRGEG